MTAPVFSSKKALGPFIVPLLFALIFAILLLGQYASKNGALLLNEGDRPTALLFIATGYCCLVLRGFIWIVLLKFVRLSVAYPIQSFSFILIALLGAWAFQETISPGKIAGIVLILSGVMAVTFSK